MSGEIFSRGKSVRASARPLCDILRPLRREGRPLLGGKINLLEKMVRFKLLFCVCGLKEE